MPTTRLRGRVINKITRQPIAGVVVQVRRNDSAAYGDITLDSDGEFDHQYGYPSSSSSFELKIDKDAGYKVKYLAFQLSSSAMSKDFGVIELEPYTD